MRQTKLDSEYLSRWLHCCAADTTGRETYTVKLIVVDASGGSGVDKRGADNYVGGGGSGGTPPGIGL